MMNELVRLKIIYDTQKSIENLVSTAEGKKGGAKDNVIDTETWKFIGPIQVFDIESVNRPRKCDPRDSDKIVARSRASRIAKSPGLMGFRAIYKASFAALFTRQASAPNKGREENLSRNRRAGNLRWNRNETASVEK